jgi:hypothetical protein
MSKFSVGIIIALVVTGLLITATTLGLLSVSQEVSFDGTITTLNVGLFLDQDSTQNCTSLSWGGVYAGESVSKTIYVKNTGDLPLTLSMSITDWNPKSANGPLSMTWNRENYVLDPEEVIDVALILTISENVEQLSTFGYNMLIIGTG